MKKIHGSTKVTNVPKKDLIEVTEPDCPVSSKSLSNTSTSAAIGVSRVQEVTGVKLCKILNVNEPATPKDYYASVNS